MTAKTTTAPLDRLTLEEWRATFGVWIGTLYADMDANAQTELDRIINEAHEYVSKRAAHAPWGKRQTTISVVSGTATYNMPADFRHALVITEADSNSDTTKSYISDLESYEQAWGLGDGTHPWANRDRPTWYRSATSNAEPPVEEWTRVPSPTATYTATVTYRPYFSLLAASGGGADRFTMLPASEVRSIKGDFMYQWSVYTKDDPTRIQIYQGFREDAIAAAEINDRTEHEVQQYLGLDPNFSRQLGG